MPRIADLEKMLAAEPNDAFLLYALAQEHSKAAGAANAEIAAQRGHLAAAISLYDRCLAADSNYFYAYFHKARTQQIAAEAGIGDISDSISTLRAGLVAARAGGDAKAMSEIQGLLDELE
jgi:hypothetical protein